MKSMLIARRGKLVFERYFNRAHRDSLHLIFSCSKSFTSALIGIAIDQGLIADVNESLYSFFPKYDSLRTPQKDSILLYHALTMTDGMDWDEWSFPYDQPGNDFYHMHRHHTSFTHYILSKGIDVPPGTRWRYNSSMTVLLGQIIRNVSGLYADQYAEQYLFGPLGIDRYLWWNDWRGRPWTHYGLHLKPRDFIKLGQLYLDEGIWNGQRLVSSLWVADSRVRRSTAPMWGVNYGYGYQWWTHNLIINSNNVEYYFASGDEGQMIIVVPELEMVVSFTMVRPNDNGANFILDLLTNYIFPSAQ
jgi:CubicO group peptidase (beta-lactamase class C family)